MSAALTSVGAPDGGDEHVLDRVPCRCGQLAAVVITDEAGVMSVSLRCLCGAFTVPGTGEGV